MGRERNSGILRDLWIGMFRTVILSVGQEQQTSICEAASHATAIRRGSLNPTTCCPSSSRLLPPHPLWSLPSQAALASGGWSYSGCGSSCRSTGANPPLVKRFVRTVFVHILLWLRSPSEPGRHATRRQVQEEEKTGRPQTNAANTKPSHFKMCSHSKMLAQSSLLSGLVWSSAPCKISCVRPNISTTSNR